METNELIECLKHCQDPEKKCIDCERWDYDCNGNHCVDDLLWKAAVALESLQNRICELETELRDERHRHDRYVDFELAQSKELQELRKKDRWTPVTERLPEYGQEIIAYSGGVVAPKVFGYTFWSEKYTSCQNITHWMPLPEAPKEIHEYA